MDTQVVFLDPVGLEKKCTVTFQAPDSLRVEALKVCRLQDVSLAAVLRNTMRDLVARHERFQQKKR